MAAARSDDVRDSGYQIGGAVRRHWVLFLVEGIVLAILGTLALLAPVIASVAATVLFGWLLLLSGIVGLVTTFRARHAPGFWWSLLSALLGIVAGVVLLGWPLLGTLSLTAVLIAFLFAEGIISIMYALEHRNALSGRWGWMLASGMVDIGLGVLLFIGLPGTSLWALGLLLGINLIFGGWALIFMALHARPTSAAAAA
ncbi:MAG TPA: HdeD family acid-resistance protein [Steroidobacteraceae bacterium]|nr:HdeD family acid-resistance protein [Steroidobacteraceae bacterium]